MKCVLYARVSTEQQAERDLSLPAQLEAMRAYAQQRAWAVVGEFVEAGVSGRTAERPALKQLLGRCKRAPTVDVVLVHKIDRLARNVFDHATIRAVLKQRGVRLASVVENVDDSITGQLVENIMASLAEFYSANLAEETKKGMRMMVQRGGWPHRPPTGYRITRDHNNRAGVEVDEATAPLVRRLFHLYATGSYSLNDLARAMEADGFLTGRGRRLPIEYIRQVLQNPFYIGRIRWKKEEVDGRHAPLVDESTFSKAARVLKQRAKDPGEKGRHRFWLRGVAVCGECGHRMTAEVHGRYRYYRCWMNGRGPEVCSAAFSNVKNADESAVELLRTLRIDVELKKALEVAAAGILRERAVVDERKVRSATMRLVKLEERESRLATGFVDGDVSADVYKELKTKLAREKERVQRESHPGDPRLERERVANVIMQAHTLVDLHDALVGPARQRLLRIVFSRIVLDRGRIVDFQMHPPFDRLLRVMPSHGTSDSLHSGACQNGASATVVEAQSFSEVLVDLLSLKDAETRTTESPKKAA